MDVFGRLVAAFIAVTMILISPLKYIAQTQEEAIEDVISRHTAEFADEARHKGSITLDSYEDLISKMDRTGELFDITIEASHPVTGKEIAEKEEEKEVQTPAIKTSYVGNIEVENSINLMASHTHSNACYTGHRHSSSCILQSEYSAFSTQPVATTFWGRVVYYENRGVKYVFLYCKKCSEEIGLIARNDNGWQADANIAACPKIFQTNFQTYWFGSYANCITPKYNFDSKGQNGSYTLNPEWGTAVAAFNNLGSIVATWNYSTYSGYFEVTAEKLDALGYYYESGCPAENSINKSNAQVGYQHLYSRCSFFYNALGNIQYNFLKEDTTPICSQVVTSITPTNPTQSVSLGNSIVTTATATYLDGHTGTVSCTVTGYNPNTLGSQTATLTYTGLVGDAKTSGTRTCTVNVTVVTANYPTGLTVTPSSYDVYDNKEPTYTVVVNYKDGSTKTITTGFTKTGWTTGIGQKSVTFTYTENGYTVTYTLIINVLPNLTSITAAPTSQQIKRYEKPSFTVQAFYEDGTNKTISSGYIITGLDTSLLGSQNVTISYTVNGKTRTATVQVIVNKLNTTCPICGTTYELNDENIDEGCPTCATRITEIIVSPTNVKVHKGEELPIGVIAVFQNGLSVTVNGWTSNYDPNMIGINEVIVSYQGFEAVIYVETIANEVVCPICGREYSLEDDGTDNGCPYCSKELVSIDVLEESVEIEMFQPLPINVISTFKDGHMEVITDWSSDLLADTPGTFEVTVFYQSVSDILTVTVLSDDRITCEYCGLEYIGIENPNGCPVCSKTIVSIETKLRYGGNQVLYKSQLNLELTLIYKDTHREVTFTGYIVTGYQSEQLGTQTVTVFYEALFTTLTIEVIAGPAKVICPSGHEYYLEEDGTDKGCPYCNEDTDKNNAIFYFDITFTNEIVSILYEDGVYYLNSGDYLTVEVVQRDVSIRSKLAKMPFFNENIQKKKRYIFGGEVT